ncbi:596_t:CDS:2 [Funneliformis geosporum]|uniref:14959_t:CDS:1 n=1 Tax=Funneliformis geosporum TaxID=1117311 RepID=A0A9W4SLQ8_9GLOM|nr:596_t:CDS:2 [Funneliformis geosporum]CAI2173232.1 14959_t:CDS:2 [Funneliformis geosporum]
MDRTNDNKLFNNSLRADVSNQPLESESTDKSTPQETTQEFQMTEIFAGGYIGHGKTIISQTGRHISQWTQHDAAS